mmetsp:Transcript_23400/g.42920  ORF Transcript_23400/g.42920 Transcript_23400/m.42920 type:complete len:390 (-) Transcript_23400:113-1282(-)
MTETNRDVSLHDLPETLSWLNRGAFARVASFAAQCFPSAVENATALWIYRGLVIQYDAEAGLTHQPMHRDGALISCVMPLSERSDYQGGGTYIETLGRSIAVEQGCGLFHPSALRHAGHRIRGGVRWVLVLFMNTLTMRQSEHARRFFERGQEMLRTAYEMEEHNTKVREAESDNEDLEEAAEECLLSTLKLTGESDHEAWCGLGMIAWKRSNPEEALRLFQRAIALNPKDAKLFNNMGNAYADLGRAREAFECYCRVFTMDRYNVEAWFNAAALLYEEGRMRKLAQLFEKMPQSVKRDKELQEIQKTRVASEALDTSLDYMSQFLNQSDSFSSGGQKVEEHIRKQVSGLVENTKLWSNGERSVSELKSKKKEVDDAMKKIIQSIFQGA